ncbi:hypothetical protein L7F22_002764 [Adiantum nelumboides]|nr:hypothetical protein [Adiantum nelumboides]
MSENLKEEERMIDFGTLDLQNDVASPDATWAIDFLAGKLQEAMADPALQKTKHEASKRGISNEQKKNSTAKRRGQIPPHEAKSRKKAKDTREKSPVHHPLMEGDPQVLAPLIVLKRVTKRERISGMANNVKVECVGIINAVRVKAFNTKVAVNIYIMPTKEEGYPIILGRPQLMAMKEKQDWGTGLLKIQHPKRKEVFYSMKNGKQQDLSLETSKDELSTKSTTTLGGEFETTKERDSSIKALLAEVETNIAQESEHYKFCVSMERTSHNVEASLMKPFPPVDFEQSISEVEIQGFYHSVECAFSFDARILDVFSLPCTHVYHMLCFAHVCRDYGYCVALDCNIHVPPRAKHMIGLKVKSEMKESSADDVLVVHDDVHTDVDHAKLDKGTLPSPTIVESGTDAMINAMIVDAYTDAIADARVVDACTNDILDAMEVDASIDVAADGNVNDGGT